MIAQKRQVRIVAWFPGVIGVDDASCIVDCASNGEELVALACTVVLCSAGCSSCVAMLVSQMRLMGGLSV
jgi:hypothetical protein